MELQIKDATTATAKWTEIDTIAEDGRVEIEKGMYFGWSFFGTFFIYEYYEGGNVHEDRAEFIPFHEEERGNIGAKTDAIISRLRAYDFEVREMA